MIKEIIVVEGKDDISAVKRAVDAELIATNGYGFPKYVRERIAKASKTRGVIVLTDPDYAGEKIRKEVEKIAGRCKHAYIPRDLATKGEDIGVENASPEAIVDALKKARSQIVKKRSEFTMTDMLEHGLTIRENASEKRDIIGAILGIGYGNTKQFLSRLNNFGITREEFDQAIEEVVMKDDE
ncbi:MAG: ribonuclease M5 [Peptostreptococcaceae bacterium]|nr:ribonuclease M5 [Peptostreptococcaceae bacterium]